MMNGSSILFLLVTFNILCNVLSSPTLTLRVEQSKTVVVCEASCQYSVTCAPKLLVLNEYPNNITRISGRSLTSSSAGIFVVLCYMKSSLINNDSPTVWTVKSYKSSNWQFLQFSLRAVRGDNLKIRELKNWGSHVEPNPRISVDCDYKNDRIETIRLACRDDYDVYSLGKLQILRKWQNGSSTDYHSTVLPFDPNYLTATFHKYQGEVKFQYKQQVTYTDDLQYTSFACYTINLLSGMDVTATTSENIPKGCDKTYVNKYYFKREDDTVLTYTPELENLVGKSFGKPEYIPATRLNQNGECNFQVERHYYRDAWSLTVKKASLNNYTVSQNIVLPQELSGLIVYLKLGAADLSRNNQNFRIWLMAYNVAENIKRIKDKKISLPVQVSLQVKMRMINGEFFTTKKHKFTISKLTVSAHPGDFIGSYKNMRRDKLPQTILKFSK